jgi:hypothetical protein
MVLWHGQAQIGDSGPPIGQKARAKVRVTPCFGDDPRAVLRDPFLLRQVTKLLDGRRCLEATLVERRLDRIDARFDRRNASSGEIVIDNVRSPYNPIRSGKEWRQPATMPARNASRCDRKYYPRGGRFAMSAGEPCIGLGGPCLERGQPIAATAALACRAAQ